MAANGYSVYFGSGFGSGGQNREDLLDLIVNIDPHESPLLTKSPKTVARHTLHEWLTDTLAATSTAGADEGADFLFASANFTSRVRESNWTQVFRKDILVSNTMRAVDPAGVQDEYAYQIMKALKEIGRNIEATFFASVTTATASGAPRIMKTLPSIVSASGTAGNMYFSSSTAIGGNGVASSAPLTEGIYNGMLEAIFANGGNPDTVYTNSKGKRQISQYTANTSFPTASIAARNIALADRRLVNSVDIYESDFGTQQIVLDRWVPQATSTATTATGTNVWFIESPMVRVAFLRPIKHVPLPPGGDASRGMVLGELTLEVGNQKAIGQIRDIQAI